MHLKEDVHKFTRACEHLIAGMETYRPLSQDEILLIRHYCNEVLSKIAQPRRNS